MRREIVRLCALLLALCWLVGPALAAPLEAEPPVALTSPSAMLVEAGTGTVIFEKNADERRQAASVTKLMTLLICFEELEAGNVLDCIECGACAYICPGRLHLVQAMRTAKQQVNAARAAAKARAENKGGESA